MRDIAAELDPEDGPFHVSLAVPPFRFSEIFA
jgi:hypothetical protein